MPTQPPRDLLMNTVLGTMAILGSLFLVIVSYAIYRALGMPQNPAALVATITGLAAAVTCILAIAKRNDTARRQARRPQPVQQEPPTHPFAANQPTGTNHQAEPRSPSYREVLAGRDQNDTTG